MEYKSYKYRTEISWCHLGNEVYIKNERNNEAYILKGKRRDVFLSIMDKEIVQDETYIKVINMLIEKGLIEVVR